MITFIGTKEPNHPLFSSKAEWVCSASFYLHDIYLHDIYLHDKYLDWFRSSAKTN